jgi:hypothetical protein
VGEVAEDGFRAGAEWSQLWRRFVANAGCVTHFFARKKRPRQAATPRQPQSGEAAQFVEVKLVAAAPAASVVGDSRVEIRLQNGRSLLVGPGFDAQHLRALLAVVESGHDRAALFAHTGPGVVLNVKSSLFVGNPRGGRSAAVLASLTSTCRHHEIDPQLYLTQLLLSFPSWPARDLDAWPPTSGNSGKPPASLPCKTRSSLIRRTCDSPISYV